MQRTTICLHHSGSSAGAVAAGGAVQCLPTTTGSPWHSTFGWFIRRKCVQRHQYLPGHYLKQSSQDCLGPSLFKMFVECLFSHGHNGSLTCTCCSLKFTIVALHELQLGFRVQGLGASYNPTILAQPICTISQFVLLTRRVTRLLTKISSQIIECYFFSFVEHCMHWWIN